MPFDRPTRPSICHTSSASNRPCGVIWPGLPTIRRTHFPNPPPISKRKSPKRARGLSRMGLLDGDLNRTALFRLEIQVTVFQCGPPSMHAKRATIEGLDRDTRKGLYSGRTAVPRFLGPIGMVAVIRSVALAVILTLGTSASLDAMPTRHRSGSTNRFAALPPICDWLLTSCG